MIAMEKRIKKFITAMGLAVLLVFGGQSTGFAASVPMTIVDDLGLFDVGDSKNFASGLIGPGDFNHGWEFGLNSAATTSATIQFTFDFATGSSFSGPVSLEVFNSGDSLASSSGESLTLTLASGVDYVLAISGTTLGSGVYGGTLSVAAVPVPPALLLFGTGVLALVAMAKKRKRKSVVEHSGSLTAV